MKEELEMTQSRNDDYKKIAITVGLFCVTLLIGFLLIGKDMETVIRYWLFLTIAGITVLPAVFFLFPKFSNGGSIYAKIIGLFLGGYLTWLLSSFKIVKFTTVSSIVCLGVIGLLVYAVVFFVMKKGKEVVLQQIKEKWFSILIWEVLFFLFFILFIFLLGHKIPGVETEKSMDYAIMSTLMRTDYMPPKDMWAAGKALNYYYFGQYIMTYLSRIAFVPIAYGYALAIAVIAAFCLTMSSNLVYEVLCTRLVGKKALSAIGAALGGIAVTLSGNMHYVIFAKVMPALWDMLRIPGDKPSYWFADSTRYIGYTPDLINDKTISEFPFYSFLIGDLHAHVINILVVMTILALLYSYFTKQTKEERMLPFLLIIIGFFIGICCMSNYWDFPIYLVISAGVLLLVNLKAETKISTMLLKTIGQGLLLFIIAKLVAMPFSIKFEQMIMGIAICYTHSQFYQLCILWGFPVVMIVILYFVVIKDNKDALKKKKRVIGFLQQVNSGDLFMMWLGVCGIGLVLIPELIFVKDIYVDGFPRANTMFKLTYEAFILFGMEIGYIIMRFLVMANTKQQRKVGIIGLICLVLTSGYFFTASKMWLGSYLNRALYQGIDATSYFKENMSEDMKAIEWLQDNVEGQPVVLEADGNSYTNYERVSVLTGFPTILGWHTHEWLWQNGYDFVEARENDVNKIYNGTNEEQITGVLQKYDVSYLFIGSNEYEKFPGMTIDVLKNLGEIVYQGSASSQNPVYIIKVK